MTATEYLIDLGHRRIGFLAGRRDLESARLRQQGYRRALEKAGIPFDKDLVRIGGYRADSARTAARELLDRTDRPTAIFAANDTSGIETIAAARELGLSVPEDLSVVGFDNVPESALSEPPLTTVDQSVERMGFEAVRMVLDLIDDPARDVEQVTLPTRLVERGSCRRLAEPA